MIALEVKINDEKSIIAGREDLCVLNAIINAVGVLGIDSAGIDKKTDQENDLFIHVGGLASQTSENSGTHLWWVKHRTLKVGDRISVCLIETREADKAV